MTIDAFHPPEVKLDAAHLLRRRAHMLDEISRSKHTPLPRRAERLAPRQPLLLVASLIVCALVPVAALAIANGWWFLSEGSRAPAPAAAPVVVTGGTWSGQAWQLIAYRTTGGDICFTITPAASARTTGAGAAMNCGGFRPSASAGAGGPHGITYLSGSSEQLPAYIAGPVVDTATTVVVHFADGDVSQIRTVDAPPSLGAIRFYAAPLPASAAADAAPRQSSLVKLVGLDPDGRIVACLAFTPARCV